ncbi:radical SAM family heme chaperone HemW [Echinicola jeungdonensis]|uniref:Heme chaperone HemW n=1 Tax=Echinicola jeungdonensis TaxID=709343 RepID=A0ABV5J3I7_9BACT|nr:radical SAM family heme chaperone HemW [Echinicola jeungdonensis]MDN3668587.1 radical SAM family heme chaperone HemW [Echinicola jeungdonensis]
MAGIYIHIPFCKKACHYCDFHFSTNTQLKGKMVDMICRELELQKNYLGNQHFIDTVYFGGGTPSLLSQEEIGKILNTISRHYSLSLKELTMEANPDDLSPAKLQTLKCLGVDRLSIGIQSFNDQVLKFYNRSHNAGEAFQCIENARKTGFEKLSIDLMYGFPQADHQLWKKDLEEALNINPGHISSYCLTIEPKTVLGRWTEKERFLPSSEDFNAEQFEILQAEMGKAGYIQYEISNFSLPGAFALHNSNYWKGVPYLGVGPSAHSYNGIDRQHNLANNAKYLQSLEKGIIPFERDELSWQDRLNEYLLTSLRTIWGASLYKILKEFRVDLLEQKQAQLESFQKEKLLEIQANQLILTSKGRLLADHIAAQLFV